MQHPTDQLMLAGRRCGKTDIVTSLMIDSYTRGCPACGKTNTSTYGVLISYEAKKLEFSGIYPSDYVVCEACLSVAIELLPDLFSGALRDLPPRVSHPNPIVRDIVHYRLKVGI